MTLSTNATAAAAAAATSSSSSSAAAAASTTTSISAAAEAPSSMTFPIPSPVSPSAAAAATTTTVSTTHHTSPILSSSSSTTPIPSTSTTPRPLSSRQNKRRDWQYVLATIEESSQSSSNGDIGGSNGGGGNGYCSGGGTSGDSNNPAVAGIGQQRSRRSSNHINAAAAAQQPPISSILCHHHHHDNDNNNNNNNHEDNNNNNDSLSAGCHYHLCLPQYIEIPSTCFSSSKRRTSSSSSSCSNNKVKWSGWHRNQLPVHTKTTRTPTTTSRQQQQQQHHYHHHHYRAHKNTPWLHHQAQFSQIRLHWIEATAVTTTTATTNTANATSSSSSSSSTSPLLLPPLIVLLHGWAEFWYSWRHQIPILTQAGYHVLVPDLRGCNLSEKGGDQSSLRYDIATTTQDIYELIQHVWKRRQLEKAEAAAAAAAAAHARHQQQYRKGMQQQQQHHHHDDDDHHANIININNNKKGSNSNNSNSNAACFFFVVGHDWGGMIAWRLATLYPDQVKGLVVANALPYYNPFRTSTAMNTPAISNDSWWWAFLQIPVLPEWILSWNRSRWLVQYWASLAAASSSNSFTMSEETMQLYQDAASQPGAVASMLACYRQIYGGGWCGRGGKSSSSSSTAKATANAAHGMDMTDMDSTVYCPVLILWGQQDPIWGSLCDKEATELSSLYELVRLPDVGHLVQQEAPDLFNQHLLQFLHNRAHHRVIVQQNK